MVFTQSAISQRWQNLAGPEIGDKWVQPAQNRAAQPIWGHKNGIRIGLAPMPGPRGLIRIYTPYLGHEIPRLMNFLAMEPIAKGSEHRGLSELEWSDLDGVWGKRFWSANDSSAKQPPALDRPAQGVIETVGGKEALSLYIFSEKFLSGAEVFLRIRFYEDSPYEIEVTTFKSTASVQLDQFIVTATMGNYARLRNLYVKGEVVSAPDLWPDYTGDAFTLHKVFDKQRFIESKSGDFYFIAGPDEERPDKASYAAGTASHWKYSGKKAVQYWKVAGDANGVKGLVNGRYTYWASTSVIPGGISFENFELSMPFENGRSLIFGISPERPEELLARLKDE